MAEKLWAGFYTLLPGLEADLTLHRKGVGDTSLVVFLPWQRGFLEEPAGRKPHVASFHWTVDSEAGQELFGREMPRRETLVMGESL